MHHQHAKSQDFVLKIYDIISADYDISPGCGFSHGKAHMCLVYSSVDGDVR